MSDDLGWELVRHGRTETWRLEMSDGQVLLLVSGYRGWYRPSRPQEVYATLEEAKVMSVINERMK